MRMRLNNRKGFTLVEILVVVALTILIMGLVFGPLANTLSLTRNAEVRIRTQDDARFALSIISRDLADAMYVYDNTDPIDLRMEDGAGGTPTFQSVQYAKIDLVLPRMRGYCPNDPTNDPTHTPGGEPRGDEAAPTCPFILPDGSVCGVKLELKPIQPLTPDTKIVRYFIGLRDPGKEYVNGFRNKFTGDQQDNMFILYRAEFSPFDNPDETNRLFPAGRTANDNISDPRFFCNQNTNGFQGGETYADAWKKISRPIVVPNNTDLITINSSDDPIPTVRFMPTLINNERLVPVKDAGDDPEHGDALPTRYKAKYGHWVLPYTITVDPSAGRDPDDRFYYIAEQGVGALSGSMCIYKEDSAGKTLVFNITHYETTRDASLYGAGDILPVDPELAFTVDTMKGTVNCAFPMVDTGLSDSLNLAVSEQASTDTINAECAASPPYRRLPFNLVANRKLLDSTVVRGSVKVIGPNATPGSGGLLLYSRLPYLLHDPGINQYTVDYEYDNPTSGVAAIYFHSLQTTGTIGESWGTPLPAPEPAGTNNVFLYYEVQNNKKGDVFRATYTTKSLITVIMGIRVYDSGSGRPAQFQLTNKVKLRNIKT